MQLFEPVAVKKCVDIGIELKKVCELYALEPDMVSFDVLHIDTFYRNEKKKDFSLLSQEDCIKLLSDEEQYNQNDFDIKQVYNITIRGLKDRDLSPFVALHLDKECYEITLELKAGLEVGDDDTFFTELYAQITRQKIAKKIIIRIFDEEQIKQEIQSLKSLFASQSIRGKIETTRKIVVAKSTTFAPSISPTFNFTLREEWNLINDKNVDFASFAVKSGELVGFSIKAQEGTSGRNLRGEYIHAKKQDMAEDSAKLNFKDSEFRITDKERVIEYYSLQDGYVSVGDGELRLLVDFNFAEVSVRQNGSLLGGDKKGFAVEVSCTDPNQDAIGAGVMLEASDVKIYGSIAENVKIVAKKVEVNGQTHQNSTIKADDIKIGIHKGLALGEKVHIDKLEIGNVEGEEVFIEEANGGSIKARDITIANLHSHTKVSLTNRVHIQNMHSGENHFLISSRVSLRAKEKVNQIDTSIKQNIDSMNFLLGVLNRDLSLVRKMKPVIEKIKSIMGDNKKNHKINERNITDSVAQYVILLQRTKYLKEKLLNLRNDSKKLNAELELLDKQTQDASIVGDVPWMGENEIVYQSFFPEGKNIMLLSDGESVNICIDKENLKLQKVERQ